MAVDALAAVGYVQDMPIIDRLGKWRVLIYSREINRPHVHLILKNRKGAKIWLVPDISLARNEGLSLRQLADAISVVERKKQEYLEAWHALRNR